MKKKLKRLIEGFETKPDNKRFWSDDFIMSLLEPDEEGAEQTGQYPTS